MKMKTESDKKPILSEKQLMCLEIQKQNKLRRINILEGSVRSGKTYVSLILWGFYVATTPKNAVFLMAAKTLSTLKRNILQPLEDIFGADNFTYSISKKEGVLFGHIVYLEGVCDARGESKIRGLTLDGAYCDELTLLDESFFVMLLSRLSKPGAKLIATTNPDHPNHWLKKNYIDNDNLDLLDVKFTLDDNIFLDEKYVKSLKNEYKGMFYDRFIKGMWVAAEGRIYTDFTHDMVYNAAKHEPAKQDLHLISVGVDYGGNKSASAFCVVGFDNFFNNVYVLDEYYDKKNKSAEHLIKSFASKIDQWEKDFGNIYCAYCDSAEQLLVKSFREAVQIPVRNAIKKPVNSRISMVCRLMSAGRFHVSSKCPNLINALETAVWDDKKFNADVRLDNGTSNIDSLDALEYALERFDKELFLHR